MIRERRDRVQLLSRGAVGTRVSVGATSFKGRAPQQSGKKQGNRLHPQLKSATAPRRSAGWSPGSSRGGGIKIAPTKSGIFAIRRTAFGRKCNSIQRQMYTDTTETPTADRTAREHRYQSSWLQLRRQTCTEKGRQRHDWNSTTAGKRPVPFIRNLRDNRGNARWQADLQPRVETRSLRSLHKKSERERENRKTAQWQHCSFTSFPSISDKGYRVRAMLTTRPSPSERRERSERVGVTVLPSVENLVPFYFFDKGNEGNETVFAGRRWLA